MKAMILGCGPAGLLAAHACSLKGIDVEIYSIEKPSKIYGAQFLQQAIPDITDGEPDGHIVFNKVGTRQGYATQVYGRPDAPCSWDEYEEGLQPAWHLRSVYDDLWTLYSRYITDLELNSAILTSLEERQDVDFRFSAVPAQVICWDHAVHKFDYKRVWATETPAVHLDDNVIVYSGREQDSWYRTSNLFGHYSTEWSHQIGGAKTGIKPLSTNCNCRPMWQRIGRFGRWKRGVLVHDAFNDVIGAIGGLK